MPSFLPKSIESNNRIEAFSNGFFAIIVTLLIFKSKVPALIDLSNSSVFHALLGIAPKDIGFALSFFTTAIFWVTYHYIFHLITDSTWKLMWFNNLLLFWLASVPFTTAFIGDYQTQSIVVSIYALNLFLATLSFSLMTYYDFFKSNLMADSVSEVIIPFIYVAPKMSREGEYG